MSTAVANPVIEKQAFRNDSPGWLGVVRIGPKGEDRGASVAPGDIVWLSEAEQILTANAPRRAEDNPFIEQELAFGVDEDGKPITKRVVPLVPITENRYVPAGDRPIPATRMETPPPVESAPPADDAPDEAAIAAREAAVVAAVQAGEAPKPVVPTRAAAAEAAQSEPVVTPPVATNDAVPPSSEEETAAAVVPEEHVETGAAVAPQQEATEGEYAAQEEVGTPSAPAAAPVPYVPPQEG